MDKIVANKLETENDRTTKQWTRECGVGLDILVKNNAESQKKEDEKDDSVEIGLDWYRFSSFLPERDYVTFGSLLS